MRNILTLSTVLVLLASPVMAFGDKTTNHGGDASASSSASAGAAAGAHSSSGVYGSGNSSNRNSNSNRAYGGSAHQGQAQGQIQGQSQSNRVNNSDSTKVEGDDVEVYNPGAASAAGNNVWDCSQSWNVEARSFLAGVAVGIPQSDEVCEAGQLLNQAITVNKHVEMPHLITLAADNLRMLLQDRVGYKATVTAIKTEDTGKTYVHSAKPDWCERVKPSSTDSDKRACGLI